MDKRTVSSAHQRIDTLEKEMIALGDSATSLDYAWDLTHDQKKERVKRSVGYLKHQKETYSDWGDKDFTVINAAITAADNFTG
mgnify:CR=1 FL=1